MIAIWLPAFDKARRIGKERLATLVARLASEAGSGPSVPPGDTETRAAAATVASPARRDLRSVVQLVARMRAQHKRLKHAWATSGPASAAIVAIAIRRLRIGAEHSPRERLAELARPMPGSPPGVITRTLAEARPLLLFEPQGVSSEWARAEQYWDEGLYVVDYAFIAYSAVASPLRFTTELCRSAFATARDGVSLSARGLKPLAAAVFLTGAYRALLPAPPGRVEAFFFTSNSFATEVLRTFLIESPWCGRIHEILHGVPTRELDVYMRELFAQAPGGGKHGFVPQLPDLDLYGAFAAPDAGAPRLGINAAVNRYFLEKPADHADRLAWIVRNCREIGVDPAVPAPLIVAIPGASTIESGYMSSPAFGVEQTMIGRVRSLLEERGEPYVLVYTPHPAYPRELFTSHPFFASHGVTIHPDTIFTWLVADLSIGLYSSALFEAEYAGAKVFSPMREDDGLYPSSLLDRLSHPAAGQVWPDALTEFVRANANRGAETALARAERRLARFIPINNDGARGAHNTRSVSSYV